VAPRRYSELFERGSRKKNGKFEQWIHGAPMPNINILVPLYASFEAMIANSVIPPYINKANFNPDKVLNKYYFTYLFAYLLPIHVSIVFSTTLDPILGLYNDLGISHRGESSRDNPHLL
jgi:hypothetical protein